MTRISPDDQCVAAGLSASHSEVQLPTLGTQIFLYRDVSLFLHMNTLTVTEQTRLPPSRYFSVHVSSMFERVLQRTLGSQDPSNPSEGGLDSYGPTIV